MKKLLLSVFLIAGAGSLPAQDVTVIPEKTARQIESIRSKAEKETSDADKKMECEIRKGEEMPRQKEEKAIAKAKQNES